MKLRIVLLWALFIAGTSGCGKATLTKLESVAAGDNQEVWVVVEETYTEGGSAKGHSYAVHHCTPETCKLIGVLKATDSPPEASGK